MTARAGEAAEVLALPEPARSLFRKVRRALEVHVGAYAADGEGFKLGGGTVLAARWKHRRSDDVDVTYHPDTRTAHFETSLREALEAVGGRPLGWGEWSRIEFGARHLDLLKAEPAPAIGHGIAVIDGRPTTVLTNAQILNGKLLNRALDPPVRDVYDVAVCGIEDPQTLEIVINGLYEATIDATILGWKMNERKHAEAAAEQLQGVPSRLESARRNPARYAVHAAERALYDHVAIEVEQGVAHVRTRCSLGERRRSYASAGDVERGFEAAGINAFLRAHGENAAEARRRAVEGIEARETAVLLAVKPRLPPRRAGEVDAVPPRAR